MAKKNDLRPYVVRKKAGFEIWVLPKANNGEIVLAINHQIKNYGKADGRIRERLR